LSEAYKETDEPWIQVNFNKEVTIYRIDIYDRKNNNIRGSRVILQFSDGSRQLVSLNVYSLGSISYSVLGPYLIYTSV
jgi:hypothetical protein